MLELIAAALAVVVASALCSGTEAALFSVPLVRVRQLAENQQGTARILLHIRENMSRPIATIVILNNVANIVGSIAVGTLASNVLGSEWLGVFSGLLTFAVIIFSEIIPKTLGERFSEQIGLFTARPVAGLTWLFTPVVWLVERVTSLLVQGARRPTTNEAEIQLLARIGYQEGIIENDESEMIQRVFLLNDITAGDLMTPRVKMTYLEADTLLYDAKDHIAHSQHSRIVVLGESIDDVLGIVLKNDLLCALVEAEENKPVRHYMKEAQFVAEAERADKLLVLFQQTRRHIAIVVDEFFGVAGVVTLEDVLEVLTGEIVDETDTVIDLQEDARRRSRRRYRLVKRT